MEPLNQCKFDFDATVTVESRNDRTDYNNAPSRFSVRPFREDNYVMLKYFDHEKHVSMSHGYSDGLNFEPRKGVEVVAYHMVRICCDHDPRISVTCEVSRERVIDEIKALVEKCPEYKDFVLYGKLEGALFVLDGDINNSMKKFDGMYKEHKTIKIGLKGKSEVDYLWLVHKHVYSALYFKKQEKKLLFD